MSGLWNEPFDLLGSCFQDRDDRVDVDEGSHLVQASTEASQMTVETTGSVKPHASAELKRGQSLGTVLESLSTRRGEPVELALTGPATLNRR